MTRRDDGEFYVGYLPRAPEGLARWLRVRIALVIAVSIATGLFLIAMHGPFAASVFEFGNLRSFTGTIVADPYPTLRVHRSGTEDDASSYLLVAPGKFGATEVVAPFDGASVELEGTLVFRDGRTLIEVAPSSVVRRDHSPIAVRSATEELGVLTLEGEIVDSKCFLGVMNPGNLKPHRACAVRCISGGIPPLLHVVGEEGRARQLLLVSADGSPVNEAVLSMVAEPVRITGRVTREGDLLFLWSDPSTYERLE